MDRTNDEEPYPPPPSAVGCVETAYHRLSDMQFELALTYLQKLPLIGNETLLDAGCGNGRITQRLLERLPHGHVIALASSKSALDAARQEVKSAAGQRLNFYQVDLQTWCEPLAADVIFSNMALHSVADHAQLFNNFAKILRPGGRLALQFGCSEHKIRLTSQLMHFIDYQVHSILHSDDAFNFTGTDVRSTQAYLHAAGFTDIQVESLPTPHSAHQGVQMADLFSRTLVAACPASVFEDDLHLQDRAQRDQILDQALNCPFNFIRASARLP
jgi:trans-aconitate 2-methyltransferase